MSLLFGRQQRALGDPGQPLIPDRPTGVVGNALVTPDTAMRHSAVWAALRLRADLISTMPFGVFRQVGDLSVSVPTPPVLLCPGGSDVRMMEWLYASQVDLDRYGNAFGLITGTDGLGLPSRIDLVPASSVVVLVKSGVVSYMIGGKPYAANLVWHERAYPVAGSPVGLSPITYAAFSVGQYLSAQRFAAMWFAGGQVPKGHLKNSNKTVQPADALLAKTRFNRIFEDGGVFVSGSDWEYNPIQAQQNDMDWLALQSASATDIGRFIGVPGDLIDAPNTGASLTYANVSQRNLQFLIMHLRPAIKRRQEAFSSKLLQQPRFVLFDAAALLLEMDPLTETQVINAQIDRRWLSVDEARAIKNRAPLDADQYEQAERLFGKTAPQAPAAAAGIVPDANAATGVVK